MSLAKIAILVPKLHKQTIDGKLEWEQTDREGAFQTSFPNSSIRISVRPSESLLSFQNDYVISIYNSSGILIESASDVDIKNELDNSYNLMKEMHETARGYALGVEQALDSIISELSKDDIPF